MKLGVAIRDVRDSEIALAEQLDAVGQRHKADHDVHHVTQALQRHARANLEALATVADRYDADVDPEDAPEEHGGGSSSDDGLLLLRDLRRLHLAYAEASINWVVLGQGAQAARDAGLLDVVSRCHPQTLRGMKWTVTRLKEAAPQALTSG